MPTMGPIKKNMENQVEAYDPQLKRNLIQSICYQAMEYKQYIPL